MTLQPLPLTSRLQKMLSENAQQTSTIHDQFLQMQQSTLAQTSEILELQIKAALAEQLGVPNDFISRPVVLFDTAQLGEFATGSMAKCFGPEFKLFDGRRYPRIPNGDLMLMSRVVEISGQRQKFDQFASIVADYDVPRDAWFFQNKPYASVPYAVWMEIALQPCGFLSAYLGTSLIYPQMDLFFRNLDGASRLINNMDVRGKTVTTRGRLLSTVASEDMIIQKFDFEVSCQGTPIFQGGSAFGFFPGEVMAKQAGLDSGKGVLPRYEQMNPTALPGEWVDLNDPLISQRYFVACERQPDFALAGGQLNLLDQVFIPLSDNPSLPGYIYALRANDRQAWFYRYHFYQDPVMPGSLGVEAILQAMQVYAMRMGLGRQFKSPHFDLPLESQLLWKYRGQILPDHQWMKLEVNITKVIQQDQLILIEGDASLWADTIRIYEVKPVAICIREA